MRKLIIPASLAALVLATPMAMAAQSMKAHDTSSTKSASMKAHATSGMKSMAMKEHSTTGTIRSMDMKARTLTLNNGKRYYLPQTAQGDSFKKGEKVRVSWMMKSGKHEASTVKMMK